VEQDFPAVALSFVPYKATGALARSGLTSGLRDSALHRESTWRFGQSEAVSTGKCAL
jgi:hypothetical protein